VRDFPKTIMYLVFDTETSGKVDFQAPEAILSQPHIAQLAAMLFDENYKIVNTMNFLIRRNGWNMQPDATERNGITDAMLDQFGVPLITALSAFSSLCKPAKEIIAFNLPFDDIVTRAEYTRIEKPHSMGHLKPVDVMRDMTPICKLPSPYKRGEYKWPKLMEAFVHVFGQTFDGAHDALNDVKATASLAFYLKSPAAGNKLKLV
jgi:DNA polymerase III alpha subunit (gram-positive type)